MNTMKRFRSAIKIFSILLKIKIKKDITSNVKRIFLRSNDCLLFDPFSVTRHAKKKNVRYFRGEARRFFSVVCARNDMFAILLINAADKVFSNKNILANLSATVLKVEHV